MTKPTMRIGNELGDWLQLTFDQPVHPDDPSDPGWVSTPIQAELGGLFTAEVFAQLLVEEIADFRRQLDEVCATGTGTATLSSVERWVELRVTLAGDQVEVTGELGAPRTPNVRLAFEIPDVSPEQVRTMLTDLQAGEQHLANTAGPAQPPDPTVGDINR